MAIMLNSRPLVGHHWYEIYIFGNSKFIKIWYPNKWAKQENENGQKSAHKNNLKYRHFTSFSALTEQIVVLNLNLKF